METIPKFVTLVLISPELQTFRSDNANMSNKIKHIYHLQKQLCFLSGQLLLHSITFQKVALSEWQRSSFVLLFLSSALSIHQQFKLDLSQKIFWAWTTAPPPLLGSAQVYSFPVLKVSSVVFLLLLFPLTVCCPQKRVWYFSDMRMATLLLGTVHRSTE